MKNAARRLGARGMLEKPITLEALFKAVEQGLAGIARLALAAPEVALSASAQGQDPSAKCCVFLEQTLQAARAEFEIAYFRFHPQNQRNRMRQVVEKSGIDRSSVNRKLKQLGFALTSGGKWTAP